MSNSPEGIEFLQKLDIDLERLSGLNRLSDFKTKIKDSDYFDYDITKYKGDKSYNFDNFLNEMSQLGGSNTRGAKAKAGAFTLKLLKNNFDEMTSVVFSFKSFEGSILDIESGHKLDLLFENTDGLKRSIEIKNWANANAVGFEQFKAYISSGQEFFYFFN